MTEKTDLSDGLDRRDALRTFVMATAGVTGATMATTGTAAAAGTTYYIDSQNGSNSASGTSKSEAWKSLSAVNSRTFGDGDRILLKRDSVFSGEHLDLDGSGSSGSPIVLSDYGSGSLPHIKTNGTDLEAVRLHNEEYWEFSNIQVSNDGGSRASERRGISLVTENFGTANHIHITSCWIHDVNGTIGDEGDDSGGIIYEPVEETASTKSAFADLRIDGCTVENVDQYGIRGVDTWYQTDQQLLSTDVVIRNNSVSTVGASGIVARGTQGALVEHNTVEGAAQHVNGIGIWCYGAFDTTIQFNESRNTQSSGTDNQGFDADYYCENTLIQYNYSHDNAGGFCAVFDNGSWSSGNIGNKHPTIRYNVSEDDAGAAFYVRGPKIYNLHAYNNVIYTTDSYTYGIQVADWNGYAEGELRWENNIWYGAGKIIWKLKESDGVTHTFNSNCFAGDQGSDVPTTSSSITSDPQFVDPGSGDNGRGSVDGYKLQSGSPCLGAATSISNDGGRDYWGNSNGSPDNIGAYAGSGIGSGGGSSGELSGTYNIVNQGDGTYLYSSNTAYNSNGAYYVVTWPNQETWSSLQWRFEEVSTGVYHIINQEDGAYLYASDEDYSGWSKAKYAVTWPNEKSWNSLKWEVNEVSSGVYRFVNVADGSYLYTSDESYEGYDQAKRTICWPQSETWDSMKWTIQSV